MDRVSLGGIVSFDGNSLFRGGQETLELFIFCPKYTTPESISTSSILRRS